MTFQIDTDIVISYLNGRRAAVDLVDGLRSDGIALGEITYGEVLEGLMREASSSERRANFEQFVRGAPLVPVTADVMDVFAKLREELRRTGQLIPDMDLLIASTAIQSNLTLVTCNRRNFDRVPGLQLYEGT